MKSKNQNTAVLSVMLVAIIIVAYKILFATPMDESQMYSSVAESEKIIQVLREVESINFKIGNASDPKLDTLESIETPLPNLPVGKTNPFSSTAN